mmetsp:Transcript_31859/g.101374  ORF Transcript_31859/g.101374 Transcript_31859/m.101374 type:complete len:201 (-) Transcript_31859:946-1548(-)
MRVRNRTIECATRPAEFASLRKLRSSPAACARRRLRNFRITLPRKLVITMMARSFRMGNAAKRWARHHAWMRRTIVTMRRISLILPRRSCMPSNVWLRAAPATAMSHAILRCRSRIFSAMMSSRFCLYRTFASKYSIRCSSSWRLRVSVRSLRLSQGICCPSGLTGKKPPLRASICGLPGRSIPEDDPMIFGVKVIVSLG